MRGVRVPSCVFVLCAAFAVRCGERATATPPRDASDVFDASDVSTPLDAGDVSDTNDADRHFDAGDVSDANDADRHFDAGDVSDANDADRHFDAGDAVDTSDVSAAIDASCGLDGGSSLPAGSASGFVRFLNLARGIGAVRFIARNQPLYRDSLAVAVVPEGASSGHIEMLAISYSVEVAPAGDAGASATVITPDDGGALPDASTASCHSDAGSPGTLTSPLCADVYLRAGCTIVLAGSLEGTTPETRLSLWSIPDIPARTGECATAGVRVMSAYAEAPPIDVDLDGFGAIARATGYHSPTGSRRVPSGVARFTVQSELDAGVERFTATLNPSHMHTLFVWGDALGADRRPSALIVDDLPPALW